MVELLVAVVAIQYLAVVSPPRTDAVWLAGDCLVPLAAPAGQIDNPIGY
jgi:hypothetical protein